jgi:methylated-DNA-[protein]-cysteine S-methyltransferase
MNSIILNFHNIFDLEISWDNEIEKITNLKILTENNFKYKSDNLPYFVTYTIKYLENYFDKNNFKYNLKYLDFTGITDFQEKIYKNLFNIKIGQSTTYGELAELSGFPKAYRAVGSTMKKNPFPLIIPCHRVLSKNAIGGFAPGIRYKSMLLELESIYISIY